MWYFIEKNNSEIMVVTRGIQTIPSDMGSMRIMSYMIYILNKIKKTSKGEYWWLISLNMDFNSDFISTRNKNLQI
ncbi:hypothetical protein RclHR1_00480015 [Rhizophagus clarus]|uniref:Uncharacterized protein n=1 Tax=Rhizophagus clarus TaxID=94130 RepID=A0A2Z6RIU2_9GLOM|nr:hypothetical protein RclHR1_00480015 [Rhizophagus clarus]